MLHQMSIKNILLDLKELKEFNLSLLTCHIMLEIMLF